MPRTILKSKIQALVRGDKEPTDSEFARIAALPEIFDSSTLDQFMLKRTESSYNERALSTRVRNAASSSVANAGDEVGSSSDNNNEIQAVDEIDADKEDVEGEGEESRSQLENRSEAEEDVLDEGSGDNDEHVSDSSSSP